ncbi:hypothetical protein B0H65DRAFT_426992 [Neurospora tetraspora]|uniref:Uncharacterized protein n=1 Tax=Neurospora tetraspora TaxID=94610 RepID=A0AAE0MS89_9PEZI|nr:hypothetical protein B0H65DRAFT_426992 [Neurospora tetraspora]
MLFRRFWYQFCRTNDAIRLPSLDTDAVGALGEIISFFAFATIPFDTQRLPNNNWIGNYGRLLRPDLDTFLQVWQFYDDPLFGELSAALGTRHLPLVRSVSDNAQQVVANVFLDCELEPAGDPERIEATVCFNAGNQIHVREVTRSWINFKNNVDKRLEQLAPWRGCYGTGMEEGTGMEKGKMLTVLPKEYFPPDTNLGNNIIEPPRIRRSYWADEPVPQLVNHDWWDTAAHYNFFLANAEERSRPVSREEPEPPRQPSLGDGLL